MFIWLHRILMMTVVVIAIFFVVSSMTFSGRFAEGVSDSHSYVLQDSDLLFQTMVQERGGLSGGCWTAGLPSFTSSTSLQPATCGVLHQTTEDRFPFSPIIYLYLLALSLR